MRPAYYNEFEPYCAAWLRNLIAAGLIPAGEVDDRSIEDVKASDLQGFGQCHFFAGLGGWPYALRLAGVADDVQVWTGSCPCQPLSGAGQRKGHDDARHLWPAFFELIAECRPPVVFGEQVAGPLGLEWFAGVRLDLEGAGYAVGAANLPACAVGAPHRRERLFWLADAGGKRRPARRAPDRANDLAVPAADRALGGPLADADQPFPEDGQLQRGRQLGGAGRNPAASAVGDAGDAGLSAPEREAVERTGGRVEGGTTGQPSSPWGGAEWIAGRDGKSRRVGPGLRLLAHGIPARVAKIRALGNAIVPTLAAEFVLAALEAMEREPS